MNLGDNPPPWQVCGQQVLIQQQQQQLQQQPLLQYQQPQEQVSLPSKSNVGVCQLSLGLSQPQISRQSSGLSQPQISYSTYFPIASSLEELTLPLRVNELGLQNGDFGSVVLGNQQFVQLNNQDTSQLRQQSQQDQVEYSLTDYLVNPDLQDTTQQLELNENIFQSLHGEQRPDFSKEQYLVRMQDQDFQSEKIDFTKSQSIGYSLPPLFGNENPIQQDWRQPRAQSPELASQECLSIPFFVDTCLESPIQTLGYAGQPISTGSCKYLNQLDHRIQSLEKGQVHESLGIQPLAQSLCSPQQSYSTSIMQEQIVNQGFRELLVGPSVNVTSPSCVNHVREPYVSVENPQKQFLDEMLPSCTQGSQESFSDLSAFQTSSLPFSIGEIQGLSTGICEGPLGVDLQLQLLNQNSQQLGLPCSTLQSLPFSISHQFAMIQSQLIQQSRQQELKQEQALEALSRACQITSQQNDVVSFDLNGQGFQQNLGTSGGYDSTVEAVRALQSIQVSQQPPTTDMIPQETAQGEKVYKQFLPPDLKIKKQSVDQQGENKHAMQLVEEMLQEIGLGDSEGDQKSAEFSKSWQEPIQTLDHNFQGWNLGDYSLEQPPLDNYTSLGLLSMLQTGNSPTMDICQPPTLLRRSQKPQVADNVDEVSYIPQLNTQELAQYYEAAKLSESQVSTGALLRQANANNEQELLLHKMSEIKQIVNMPPRRGMRLLDLNFEELANYLEPTSEEKSKMKRCKEVVFDLLESKFSRSRCFVYGSAGNHLCIREHNDVDLCLRIQTNDESWEFQGQIVDKIAGYMEDKGMKDVRSLPHARVPICKFTYPDTRTHVDISVNNLLPVFNTKMLARYCEIDPRVRKLVYIVKFWAKRRILNDPYHNTLSSYAYVLMVIFFLQQKGILPCLQQMGSVEARSFNGYDVYFMEDISEIQEEHKMETYLTNIQMGELTMMFFDFYAWDFFEFKCRDKVVCVRLGEFITKHKKGWTSKTGYQRHLLSIEDPFETDHDLGKLVDRTTLALLAREFQKASKVLHNDMEPQKCLFKHRRWNPDLKGSRRPPRGWKPKPQEEQTSGGEGELVLGTSPE